MSAALPWLGTLPQWGTFGTVLALLVVIVKYAPSWMQAMTERVKARDSGASAAAGTWAELERRVSAELQECRQQREADALALKRMDDENFRMRIVLSMALDELERLDPGSEIVLKAKAIMAVPTPASDPDNIEKKKLAELLAQLDAHERARKPPRKI